MPDQPHMQQPDGKVLFEQNCRKCHGVKGTPPPSMKRMMPKIPTFEATTLSQKTLQSVIEIVLKGKGDMKPFTDKLSNDQVEAVAKYVFTLANATPKSGK